MSKVGDETNALYDVLIFLYPNNIFSSILELHNDTLSDFLSNIHSSYFSVATYPMYSPTSEMIVLNNQCSADSEIRNVTANTTGEQYINKR